MPHVQSIAIESVRYDERARRLTVKFRAGGQMLVYENVPQQIYDSLLFADSISGYFYNHIAGLYRVREIGPRQGLRVTTGSELEREPLAQKAKGARRT
jgi:KTSC domain